MQILKKYQLNHQKAYEFFREKLLDVNILSTNLIDLINFSSGEFFTLLPADINLEQLHQFHAGGMCKSIKDEIIKIIYSFLRVHTHTSCIFDDFNADFSPGCQDSLFLECGFSYQKEIYYVLTHKKMSEELIRRCFFASNAIWHFLCILADINFSHKANAVFARNDIRSICETTKLIMINAYDDEGYVFWTRGDKEMEI